MQKLFEFLQKLYLSAASAERGGRPTSGRKPGDGRRQGKQGGGAHG